MNELEISNLSIEQLDYALNNLSLAQKCFILSPTDVEKQRDLLMNAKNKKILEKGVVTTS